jgi:hypothetical protein
MRALTGFAPVATPAPVTPGAGRRPRPGANSCIYRCRRRVPGTVVLAWPNTRLSLSSRWATAEVRSTCSREGSRIADVLRVGGNGCGQVRACRAFAPSGGGQAWLAQESQEQFRALCGVFLVDPVA